MGTAGTRAEEAACSSEQPAAQLAELEQQGRALELLAAVFAQKPSKGLLVALARPEAAQVFEGTVSEGDTPLARALAELAAAWERDPATTLDGLGDEYATLLERPGARSAQPWGSYYLEADGALFGAETLAVRRAYAARGFLPSGYPHEADDHLAFELAFLAELTYAACDALDEGDQTACNTALTEREGFAAEHLRPWVGRFASELEESPLAKGARLYPQAAAEAVRLLDAVVPGGHGPLDGDWRLALL